ncbi:MAG TPA: transposase, partial [Nitrososphaera sp.]|nr:transposase [Nitrososphaera sp.]
PPVPKPLAIHTRACQKCGAVLDRDYNASLNNILQLGLQILQLPVERREVTPVEIVIQQQRSLKQEAHEFIRG